MKKVVLLALVVVMACSMMLAGCANAPAPAAAADPAAAAEPAAADPAAAEPAAAEPAAADPAAADPAAAAEPAGDGATSVEGSKDVKLALVLHALNSSFFAKIQEGAMQAGKDLGITVDVMAPATPNQLTEQVNMIESCIAAGYDGIATVTWDEEGFNDVIQKAKDAGIAVVGINQDAPNSGREAFIGQDNEEAGFMLGKHMFGEVMAGEGKFIIANCAPTNTALMAREAGIQRALAEYPNIEYVETVDIGTDLTGAVGVIENAYIANPEVTAFLGVDVYSEAIGTFIASQGLEGKVYGAGFDLTEGTLEHIKNNAMQLTVGQNPFLQGYYPMVQMFLTKAYGYAPLDMNTGALLVTKDNVDAQKPE